MFLDHFFFLCIHDCMTNSRNRFRLSFAHFLDTNTSVLPRMDYRSFIAIERTLKKATKAILKN